MIMTEQILSSLSHIEDIKTKINHISTDGNVDYCARCGKEYNKHSDKSEFCSLFGVLLFGWPTYSTNQVSSEYFCKES